MKNRITKIAVLSIGILSFALTGCVYYGQDGRPGDTFLEIQPSQHFYVEYFWDNNPSVPEAFYWGHYYPTGGGTFEYEYALSDEFLYWGEYTIIPNRGEPGGYGYDGRPGLDRYFTLYCYSGGGYVDSYSKENGTQLLRDGKPYEVLSDTVIQFDGYAMEMTRNRMPSQDVKPAHTPKYVRKK